MRKAYLQLDPGLSNVGLASAAIRNLLCFGDLVSHSLGAEVLERVSLNSVDAHDGVGLDSSEAAGHYITAVSHLLLISILVSSLCVLPFPCAVDFANF
jgi:hypothetical protein